RRRRLVEEHLEKRVVGLARGRRRFPPRAPKRLAEPRGPLGGALRARGPEPPGREARHGRRLFFGVVGDRPPALRNFVGTRAGGWCGRRRNARSRRLDRGTLRRGGRWWKRPRGRRGRRLGHLRRRRLFFGLGRYGLRRGRRVGHLPGVERLVPGLL